jgi:hypothetical protein
METREDMETQGIPASPGIWAERDEQDPTDPPVSNQLISKYIKRS